MSDQLTRQELFDRVYSARRELKRALMYISEQDAVGVPFHDDLCLRDVMSHITARECTTLAAVQHVIEDGNPEFRNSLNDRNYNLAAIARRREFTLRDVNDELEGIRRELTKHSRRLPNHLLFELFPVGSSRRKLSLADALLMLAEHDELHASNIWYWRADHDLLYRDRFRRVFTSKRDEFLNALGRMFENDMLATRVTGHWTVKDVMAHLLSWDEEAYRTAAHWVEERDWQLDVVYDDEWNEFEVARRAGIDVITLADGLAAYHQQMLKLFDSLSNEELVIRSTAPWGERMALISFLYEMAQHDAVHTPDLLAAARQGRGR